MCNCASYNWKIGTDKQVIIELPKNIDSGRKTRKIAIDACIVNVIKHLWKNNIGTLACCCSHNRGNPSVVVESVMDIQYVFSKIREIDDRIWIVSKWERIEYKMPNKDDV